MASSANSLADATLDELDHWPGASVKFQHSKKHNVATVSFNGQSRKVVYANTLSDNRRGLQNHLAQVRKELRALGAVRTKPVKSEAPKRQRNKPVRQVVIERAPVRGDPFAALAGAQFPPLPVHKPSFWQRVKAWFYGR